MCIYMYRWIWIYGRRAWQPTIVFLPGESHGQRSLAGYPSVWGYKELDKPESHTHIYIHTPHLWGFPGGSLVKNPRANAGDMDWIPGSEQSLAGGNGNAFKCSCLVNPMDKGAWWATVHRVTEESDTIYRLNTTSHTFTISSVIEHVGCFHVLAIVQSASVNIWVHVSLRIRVFSRYIPRLPSVGSHRVGHA